MFRFLFRLNNQLQDVRNVTSMISHPTYVPRIPTPVSVPVVAPSYGFQASSMMPSQMQLVPYNPTQTAQLYPQLPPIQQQQSQETTKKPLTTEELQRLYSLNHAVVPRSNVIPAGYVPATPPMSNYGGYYGTSPYSMYGGSAGYPSIYPQITTTNMSNTGAAPKVSYCSFAL